MVFYTTLQRRELGYINMSFRTVVISKQSKISYKNRFLVVRNEEDEKYVHLSEIDTIIVDSISVSISSYLLKELSENKINIIFCDEKHNPFGELLSFYGKYNSSKKVFLQSKWKQNSKDLLWANIVKNKILNQALVLKRIKSPNMEMLLSYVGEVKKGDRTNREGHAAKVYFNSLFGKDFVRNENDAINAALNYGYAILLSTVNKEIVNNGYITQLGIHHKNEFNEFNLTCDLMEIFRPVIDLFVYINKEKEFNSEYKMELVNLFNKKFKYGKKSYTLKDIIRMNIADNLENIEKGTDYKSFIYEESNNESNCVF